MVARRLHLPQKAPKSSVGLRVYAENASGYHHGSSLQPPPILPARDLLVLTSCQIIVIQGERSEGGGGESSGGPMIS